MILNVLNCTILCVCLAMFWIDYLQLIDQYFDRFCIRNISNLLIAIFIEYSNGETDPKFNLFKDTRRYEYINISLYFVFVCFSTKCGRESLGDRPQKK